MPNGKGVPEEHALGARPPESLLSGAVRAPLLRALVAHRHCRCPLRRRRRCCARILAVVVIVVVIIVVVVAIFVVGQDRRWLVVMD